MPTLRKKGIDYFKKRVFDDSRMNIIRTFIKEMEKDRDEIQIDRSLLKQITNIYITINDEEGAASQIYKELEVFILYLKFI